MTRSKYFCNLCILFWRVYIDLRVSHNRGRAPKKEEVRVCGNPSCQRDLSGKGQWNDARPAPVKSGLPLSKYLCSTCRKWWNVYTELRPLSLPGARPPRKRKPRASHKKKKQIKVYGNLKCGDNISTYQEQLNARPAPPDIGLEAIYLYMRCRAFWRRNKSLDRKMYPPTRKRV